MSASGRGLGVAWRGGQRRGDGAPAGAPGFDLTAHWAWQPPPALLTPASRDRSFEQSAPRCCLRTGFQRLYVAPCF